MFQLHSVRMRKNSSGQSINPDTFVLELDCDFELKRERDRKKREKNQKKREREIKRRG